MTKSYLIIASACILVFQLGLQAQESTCKVLDKRISEHYKGRCKNGLAHGNGVAIGVDKYDGKFKKGLPYGFGIYTQFNGGKYTGYFKEGKKHGKGTFTFKFQGRDSTYNGIWKSDSLVKVILPPKYKIEKNINVTRYSVQRMTSGNRILFQFLQNGTQNRSITNFHLIANKGTYLKFGDREGYENIDFPVTCKATYITRSPSGTTTLRVEFEITINQPGDWLITIHN